MNPELFDTIFWVFFGAVSLWILWGFIRLFLLRDAFPSAARGATRNAKGHRAGGGSHADNTVAGLGVIGSSDSTSMNMSTDTSSDSTSDSGSDSGGDSGGGDFSGGGGDSGGGGSSGGW